MSKNSQYTAPPDDLPPPYPHNWTSIPDNALSPPPPSLGYKESPGANATPEEAYEGVQWCNRNPLWEPRHLTPEQLKPEQQQVIQARALTIMEQKPFFEGEVKPVKEKYERNEDRHVKKDHHFKKERDLKDHDLKENHGRFRCKTRASCKDTVLLTYQPLYFKFRDSPLITSQTKTIYYEIQIIRIGRDGQTKPIGEPSHEVTSSENGVLNSLKKKFTKRKVSKHGESSSQAFHTDSGIAIGFCAPPYPPFRLPGWHRGSLAVHSDDGHKYINNVEGGSDFTKPFYDTQVVGIGMTFSLPSRPPAYEGGVQNTLDIRVFFTRDGVRDDETHSWDGNAELDSISREGAAGLKGEADLFPAIGVFGSVDFEVILNPLEWTYTPPDV